MSARFIILIPLAGAAFGFAAGFFIRWMVG